MKKPRLRWFFLSVAFFINTQVILSFFYHYAVGITEKKADAPQTAETNNSKDYSWNYFALTAEKPAYKVEAEKTYKSPVQGTDDNESKCDFIKNLHNKLLLPTYILPRLNKNMHWHFKLNM